MVRGTRFSIAPAPAISGARLPHTFLVRVSHPSSNEQNSLAIRHFHDSPKLPMNHWRVVGVSSRVWFALFQTCIEFYELDNRSQPN